MVTKNLKMQTLLKRRLFQLGVVAVVLYATYYWVQKIVERATIDFLQSIGF